MSEPYRFAIVGAGWRSEFFLRIAQALPKRFGVDGVVVRSRDKAVAFSEIWGVATYPNAASLLEAARPEFWVSSVAYAENFAVNLALIEHGLPIFTETPPAATLEQMDELWSAAQGTGARIQVAEQFHRQPHHAARIAAVRAGKIGTAHKAYVSVSHGYHGTSLIRHYLGLGYEDCRITGVGWPDRVLDPGGRSGPPPRPEVNEVSQQLALLNFGACQAVFDFTPVQYFSPIRSQRVCIRGELGEIVDHQLHLYADGEPATLSFQRQTAGPNGNLEGMCLKAIQLGEKRIWRNRTAPARLSDEEIAMAELLLAMGDYARGGPDFYPLAEGLQDHYLALKIREACETGEPLWTSRQRWSP